ncbi:hypothetical protein B0H63DRAFT_477333 [Podospora didyma]|uniref:Rhodopsin domain-containing protein n=1 Tax=Podospora didyma TaxID=330526 RepID=A0AAE0KJT5_9PEZI|nr:hypothetical protein B0H63DRAFT_477333 [Podospora didyma]
MSMMALPFDINDIPAMQPPPGVIPNFDNPESMHPYVLGVAIGTIAVMVIAISIRVYTKAFIMRDMKWEEYFAILAVAGMILWDGIFIHVSASGFSRHFWDVRLVDVHNMSYMSYLAEISNAITMFAAKLSILFQLKRLFCTGQSRDAIYWAIHGLMFLNTTYYLSALFTFTFQCTPREKAWNALTVEGECINVAAATLVAGAMNLFLDVGILVVPFGAICHLQLPMKRKVGISAVFGVGVLTCAIAAMGVVFRIPLLSTDPDLTWLVSKVSIWMMLEYCGTILVGCMPTFPRFFLHIRGKDPLSASHISSKSKSKNSNNPHTAGTKNTTTRSTTQLRNNKKADAVGLAVTTSEVSPPYEGLEGHQKTAPHGVRPPSSVYTSRTRDWEEGYDSDSDSQWFRLSSRA